MTRFALFILFTLLLSALGYLWHDVIQQDVDPLYPAFPRSLSMTLPAFGWGLTIFLMRRKEVRDALRRIIIICAPTGLGLGFCTWFIVTGGPLVLSLPVLIPVVSTTIYATSLSNSHTEQRVAIPLLFFVVFSTFYNLAFTLVIVSTLTEFFTG